jgi:anti-sigma28 factor (negative regulator of flagellin synthesis)
MAPTKDLRKSSTPTPLGASPEVLTRQLRVEELRRLVAKGAYQVSPQRLALRILVKSLGHHSPEKRT